MTNLKKFVERIAKFTFEHEQEPHFAEDCEDTLKSLQGVAAKLCSLWEEELSEGCKNYVADYVNEELARGGLITGDAIAYAIDAYNGGAR